MHTASVRRTILFILLAVLTAAWPSSAAMAHRNSTLSVQTDEVTIPEILDRLWSFFRRVENKDGCHIDPNGRCATTQSPEPQRKDGCHIDPWGRCMP